MKLNSKIKNNWLLLSDHVLNFRKVKAQRKFVHQYYNPSQQTVISFYKDGAIVISITTVAAVNCILDI